MASVLVLDDDPQVRRVVARLIGLDGHDVVQAGDGKEALELLSARPVDLVVTDIYMPEMDGIEFIMRLRETFPDVRVIAMSGGGVLSAEHMLQTARALGAVAVVQKPFDLEVVREHLEPPGPADAGSRANVR